MSISVHSGKRAHPDERIKKIFGHKTKEESMERKKILIAIYCFSCMFWYVHYIKMYEFICKAGRLERKM